MMTLSQLTATTGTVGHAATGCSGPGGPPGRSPVGAAWVANASFRDASAANATARTSGGVAVSLASNGDRTVAVRPAAVQAADHFATTTGDSVTAAATPLGVAGKPPAMRRRQAASQGR